MADLIILHGPPASGKLTTAKQISAITGASIFHNHLTLDVSKSLFAFGTDEFWQLTNEIRALSLEAHFKAGKSALIFTWCYEQPEDFWFLDKINQMAIKYSGRILPVFVECTTESLEERVSNADRKSLDKLCSVDVLQAQISTKNYAPMPYDNCIKIDSTKNSALVNAKIIVDSFKL